MDVYFSPLACSLASRIVLYEAGADARFIEVDPKSKRTLDGDDYREIYPLGLVPLLRLDDGSLLRENAAILQYIAARYPHAELAPADAVERARLQQWLSFIGTELHKGLFIPLFDQKAPEGTHAHTLKKQEPRLKYLNSHLAGRDFLLDRFTVADAYLFTVTNWAHFVKLDLSDFPHLRAFQERVAARPAVRAAMAAEGLRTAAHK